MNTSKAKTIKTGGSDNTTKQKRTPKASKFFAYSAQSGCIGIVKGSGVFPSFIVDLESTKIIFLFSFIFIFLGLIIFQSKVLCLSICNMNEHLQLRGFLGLIIFQSKAMCLSIWNMNEHLQLRGYFPFIEKFKWPFQYFLSNSIDALI